jgi:hypothetical protein
VELGHKDAQVKDLKENPLTAKKQTPTQRLKSKTQPQYLPSHFSYSQLAAFEKCPLQYKFNFILKNSFFCNPISKNFTANLY